MKIYCKKTKYLDSQILGGSAWPRGSPVWLRGSLAWLTFMKISCKSIVKKPTYCKSIVKKPNTWIAEFWAARRGRWVARCDSLVAQRSHGVARCDFPVARRDSLVA
jgi:hypothetical protein